MVDSQKMLLHEMFVLFNTHGYCMWTKYYGVKMSWGLNVELLHAPIALKEIMNENKN
jgi:hypothetical protein